MFCYHQMQKVRFRRALSQKQTPPAVKTRGVDRRCACHHPVGCIRAPSALVASHRSCQRRRGVRSGADSFPQPPLALLVGRADKGPEQRVRAQGLRLEFRVELAAEEPGVVSDLDDLHVGIVRGHPRKAQAVGHQNLFILAVVFIAVAVALGNVQSAVGLMGKGPRHGQAPSRIVPPSSSTPRSSRSL